MIHIIFFPIWSLNESGILVKSMHTIFFKTCKSHFPIRRERKWTIQKNKRKPTHNENCAPT